MKKIYLDVAGKMHSLYKELVMYPPPGYEFTTQKTSWDKAFTAATKVNTIYAFQQNILAKIIPMNLTKAYLERFKKPPKGTDLTYATGHLVFRKEPWVVDLEFVTQLAGYSVKHFKKYKKLIEKTLASEYCQKIICWTEAGKRTVLENMNCEGFDHKMEVVNLAVAKKNFVKDYGGDDAKVKLLFAGSVNIAGEFELKGGKEVLEAFVILRQRYPNLELVIRSDIPEKIKDKYKALEGLRLIEGIIPWDQLEQHFKSADIFLFPSYNTPGLAFLDAMSYELPVITTDVWANSELVAHGTTGFLIKKSQKLQCFAENFIPIQSYVSDSQFMKSIKLVDYTVVTELVQKTSLLIEDPEQRRRMGKAGRQEIVNGKFSVERHNGKLKRIFDQALEDKSDRD